MKGHHKDFDGRLWNIVYSVVHKHEGFYVIDHANYTTWSKNDGLAQYYLVKKLREDYPDDNWRIIIHDSYWGV